MKKEKCLTRKILGFWDFIDCGKFLAESNYADENNLYAMGGSAGGLLMGAVMNMEPGLFKGDGICCWSSIC